MMQPILKLRAIQKADCQQIHEAFKEQGWIKPIAQYQKYLQYQESGERDVIIAEWDGAIAGYLTINWKSEYPPFQKKGIPEIVDMNVFQKYQRRGIASQLMEEAEKRIKKVSDYAGIGFGVTQDYGAAQILYFKRNYQPDGRGLAKEYLPLKYGDLVTIDDSIAFFLLKKL